jgi:hypothetical protein
MQIGRRHSDGSIPRGSIPRGRNLSLLQQQQKLYKVKMADLSMAYDGHTEVSSIPMRFSLPSQIQGGSPNHIVMHQPNWLEISGSATSIFSSTTSVKSQRLSQSDIVAKMFDNHTKVNSSERCISSQMFVDSADSVVSSRATTASQTTASQEVEDGPPFKKISRKKSVPRHRCNRLNRSLTSVLRPSNYPFPPTDRRLSRSMPPHPRSGLTDKDGELDTALFDEDRFYRSFSGLDVSHSSSEVDDPIFSEDRLRKLDGAVLDETRLRKSLNNLDDVPWIPKGVDFSLTVEAYFYRQH